jgi:DNA-binding protein HU-beta
MSQSGEWEEVIPNGPDSPIHRFTHLPLRKGGKAVATRIDVARAVAERQKIAIQDVNAVIGSTIDVISDLVKNGDLHLVRLGTFRLVTRPARQGRNPKSGETINIPEKRVVRFKPSKSLNPPAPVATTAPKGRGGKSVGNKRKR